MPFPFAYNYQLPRTFFQPSSLPYSFLNALFFKKTSNNLSSLLLYTTVFARHVRLRPAAVYLALHSKHYIDLLDFSGVRWWNRATHEHPLPRHPQTPSTSY